MLEGFEIRVEHRLSGYAHREKRVCFDVVLQQYGSQRVWCWTSQDASPVGRIIDAAF
jgi:hypothetical protein